MKVREYYHDNWWKLVVDKKVLSVGNVEPEDATLDRDLNFVYSISDLLEKAYEAGRNGEEYDYDFEDNQTEE